MEVLHGIAVKDSGAFSTEDMNVNLKMETKQIIKI